MFDTKSYRREVKALSPPLYKVLEQFFLKNWWVAAIVIISFLLYEQGIHSYKDNHDYLNKRLESLRKEEILLKAEQQDLLDQIRSQSDPKWIEETLKKVLGVVPEGQKKIYFQKDPID